MIKTSADLFGRVVTAMLTPFNDDLEIDFPALPALVEHLIGTGSSSLVVCGTTGESPTLDDEEKLKLLKEVLKLSAGRAKIIMGAGSNDTAKTIKAAQKAEEAGADALLLVAPYYNKPSQDGLKAHFAAVANACPLPIMLYNIPGRTGVNISYETVLQLAAEHKNIIALKDSSGNVEQAQEIARLASSHFRIYSGDDNLTLPFLSVGACGVVSVASHIIGKEIELMIESFFAGKIDDARALHYLYLPLFKGLFIAPNPSCVKYAISKMGFCKENLRLPLVPLNQMQKNAIDELLLLSAGGKHGSCSHGSHDDKHDTTSSKTEKICAS